MHKVCLIACLLIQINLHTTSNYFKIIELSYVTDNVCVVCTDFAYGANYGAVSCYSCKQFFRRVIRDGKADNLQCVKPGFVEECKIDIKNRTTCKYCRFNKCIKRGMNPILINSRNRKRSEIL